MPIEAIYRVRPRGVDKWDGVAPWRRRSVFAALGLRPPLLDATEAEARALRRHVAGARSVVEIGVYEGVGAAIIRAAMDPDGELFLIDPYPSGHLGLNMARAVARRAVARTPGAKVRWIKAFSHDASAEWDGGGIDFLRLDGEHTIEGIQRDWRDWSGRVVPGGRATLHHDVVASELNRVNQLAEADEIVPWILAESPEWELVERVDTLAVLRKRAP